MPNALVTCMGVDLHSLDLHVKFFPDASETWGSATLRDITKIEHTIVMHALSSIYKDNESYTQS